MEICFEFASNLLRISMQPGIQLSITIEFVSNWLQISFGLAIGPELASNYHLISFWHGNLLERVDAESPGARGASGARF